MGLEDTNLPSSQFAGFPNKVTFLLKKKKVTIDQKQFDSGREVHVVKVDTKPRSCPAL